MKQIMMHDELRKKIAHDIMFHNSEYCRVNVTCLKKHSMNGAITDSYMLQSDGTVERKDKPDQFVCNYIWWEDQLVLDYQIAGINSTTKLVRKDSEGNIDKPVYNTGDLADIVLLEIYRVSTSKDMYIWPVIYKVDGSNLSSSEEILRDFMNGGDKYNFEQIFTNVMLSLVTNYEFKGNDKDISDGFDIENTADFFEVFDLVDEYDSDTHYSWNPDTKILSVNTTDEEEKVIHVDLYYVQEVNEELSLAVSSGAKIFSYDMCMDNPAICIVNDSDEDFYRDSYIDIKYTVGPNNVLQEFEYLLDEETIVHTKMTKTGDHMTIMTIEPNNALLENDNVTWMCESAFFTGNYFATDCTFTFINMVNKIPSIKSYVYDFNNLYVRSIGYNAIKIL